LVDGKGNFLLEKHALSYAPAISVMSLTQTLNESASKMGHKLLAFGNPITKQIAFLGALPYAEKEVNKIASLYPPGAATVRIGESANRAAYNDLVSQFTEIHLATHGLVDEDNPLRSALVLAPSGKDDGLLTALDVIRAGNLKARLVVLSACETAKGKRSREGVKGLSWAFMIAGTPSIIVSQWNVDDVMTEFQMNKFYAAYLKGKDKATALREAQLATIAFMENTEGGAPRDLSKPRANPRYWAAFELIGEPN
jgi:CHAT domain-containing protein